MNLITRTRLLALVAALALGLAACGGDSESGGAAAPADGAADSAGGAVNIVTTEFDFEPDSLTLPAGSAEIVVDNSGGMVEHDFTIDELGISIHADALKTESEVVTLESGTYEFYCSVPGHQAAGMEGTLTVN